MKKILMKIATCIILIVCCLGVAACGEEKFDFDKARTNLKDNGYEVTVSKDAEEYTYDYYGIEQVLYAESEDGEEWMIIFCFEKSSVAKAFYAMEKEGYQEEIDYCKKENKYYETVLKYHEDVISSDELLEIKDYIKDNKEEIKECKEIIKNSGRSGKYVWKGTKYAIKDSK